MVVFDVSVPGYLFTLRLIYKARKFRVTVLNTENQFANMVKHLLSRFGLVNHEFVICFHAITVQYHFPYDFPQTFYSSFGSQSPLAIQSLVQ